MFCKHKWKIVVEKTLPSPMSQFQEVRGQRVTIEMLQKTYIVILECEKCGKLYKSVEKG